ncbi:MAG TPA: GMC family oxidoreductase [Steroidobacteraceae bacterium]|nr:GMC family oxidoreductase [Steroidobacteraceae bacterium]
MSFIDTRDMRLPASIDADICIVGAGAAGITLATQLLPTRLDICLIESGSFEPEADTQSLYDLEYTGYPLRPDYMSRARYFGGSCNLWAGRSMRLSPLDFERRDWVPHSGWPISHAEVARYYRAAGRILGLPDLDSAADEVPKRLSETERRLFAGATLTPTISAWARKPMRFGAASRDRFRSARNLRVLLNASATKLHVNEAGNAVESLETRTLAGSLVVVRARRFVLACGGIENARLLLVSRDRQPQGLGNARDQVGRYFMDHPRAVFGRIHVPAGADLPLLRGRTLKDGRYQVGIGLSPETQRHERLLNHFVTFEHESSGFVEAKYQSFIQTMKVVLRRGYSGSRWDFTRTHLAEIPNLIYLLSPRELMPHPLYRLYVALRDAMPRRPRPRTYVAVYFCEQPPDPASRLSLSGDSDRLGVPKLSLHWDLGRAMEDSVMRLQELLAAELQRTGTGTLERSPDPPVYTDASHHMGTTRMSARPDEGIVDTDCRLHGVANLYLSGSSVFPSSGHANPTLTIVALALRLADHLSASRS